MPVHIYKQGKGINETTIITNSELDENNYQNANRSDFCIDKEALIDKYNLLC